MSCKLYHLLALAVLVLAFCVIISEGHSLVKRDDLQDLENTLIPKGGVCATDSQCSFVEFCNHEGLSFHCKLQPWFIGVIVGVAILILLSLGVSCICCPCCCLYAMCRKS